MNKQIEALKMAIEAIQNIMDSLDEKRVWYSVELEEAIQACKEALEEAEKQEWQSLSDDEIGKVLDDLDIGAAYTDWMINFAYAIEAKLKEKNKC